MEEPLVLESNGLLDDWPISNDTSLQPLDTNRPASSAANPALLALNQLVAKPSAAASDPLSVSLDGAPDEFEQLDQLEHAAFHPQLPKPTHSASSYARYQQNQDDDQDEDEDELMAMIEAEQEHERERQTQQKLILPPPQALSQPQQPILTSYQIPSPQAHPGPSRETEPPRESDVPKYIPAGTIRAVSFDGKPIVFERRKRLRAYRPPEFLPGTTDSASNLLARPIHQLLEAVEAAKALQVVERDEAQAAREARQSSDSRNDRAKSSQMWVDRHRPRKFAELLGDERVHRDVLGWLKEWDECVFKRTNMRKARQKQYQNPESSGPSAAYGPKPNSAPAWKDPYGRPNERVLMLSGPPGLGKTTLAHVIANQAGYNVYELNASDARSASSVNDLIRMALESGSLKDPRPTLVVIDEIDGATGGGASGPGLGSSTGSESAGFIKALVRLIESGKGSGARTSGLAAKSSGGKRGSKKGSSPPLLRPIICICNDLYAPALRPLRPLAKLVRLNKAPTNLIVRRLRAICEQETLDAETRGLSLLAELTGGDIRSCLNALEFAKTKNMTLTETAVRTAAVGIKDTGTTLNRVWEMLFRTQTRKEKVKSSTRATDREAALWAQGKQRQNDVAMVDTPQENVNRLIHEITSCNEYERLAQGCFEHYPLLRAADDGWQRFHKAHEWLHFGQKINQTIYSMGTYEMLSFMPWSFVCWHLLFANVGNALPEYPKVDYENHLKMTAYSEIVSLLYANLPGSLRSQFNRHSVATELGPMLMRILTPDLRPVNGQLIRSEERGTLTALLDIMSSLNLRFVQDRSEDSDQLVYRLDPPLDVFTQFEGKRSRELGPSRYALRQLVARELEARSKGHVLEGNQAASAADRATAAYRKSQTVAAVKPKAALDFFGRPIKTPEESTLSRKRPSPGAEPLTDSTSSPSRKEGAKVFYRYHEGFSNAVRKPVKISALL